MTHCHCRRCQKAHGAAFATGLMVPADSFRLARGADEIGRYESSPGVVRPFCGHCGSVVASGDAALGLVPVPAGPLDDDPGVRPIAHIFVTSRAPWTEIRDELPRFDAYPPGIDATVLPDLPEREPRSGAPRGSCLCGGVTFVLEGTAVRAHHCHCSRCRKARGAAYASNVFYGIDGVRFTSGRDLVADYKLPEARFFGQSFCRRCGSPMPRLDHERGIAVVPMGSLDDDPGTHPGRHIFVASKAPWVTIADDLPQHEERPASY
jgi:hypothetical protein